MAVYGPWANDALVAWLSGKTIMAMLVGSAYVPDPDETTAPSGSEVTGTGYTAGGVDVTSLVSFSYDSSVNAVVLACSTDIDFGTVTITDIGGIVFYVDSGKPIAADMFGGGFDVTADDFTYTPDPAGLVMLLAGG